MKGRSWWSRAGWAAIVCLSFAPAAWFLAAQTREEASVREYLEARGLANLPVTRNTAVAVSQAIRGDFEVDRRKWKRFRFSRRPFLREDTRWLLEAREGQCGEGARVIVNLLGRLGFDATRLSLYDKHLRSTHTVVSVNLDGREFFVDTINSSSEVNAFLNTSDVSNRDFRLLHYTDDLETRQEAGRALVADASGPADPARERFLDKYRLYSYEAVPASKLLSRLGVDWRVLNLSRPAPWVSKLAEKPNAILCLVSLVAALVADTVLLLGVRRARRATAEVPALSEVDEARAEAPN